MIVNAILSREQCRVRIASELNSGLGIVKVFTSLGWMLHKFSVLAFTNVAKLIVSLKVILGRKLSSTPLRLCPKQRLPVFSLR